MATHSQELKLFAGNSNPDLAKEICNNLFMDLGSAIVSQFATASARWMTAAAPPSCDNRMCLWTLLDVPWGRARPR